MILLTDDEDMSLVEVKDWGSDLDGFEVPGINNLLGDARQDGQIRWVNEDDVELSDHEGNWVELWVVILLFLLPFDIADNL